MDQTFVFISPMGDPVGFVRLGRAPTSWGFVGSHWLCNNGPCGIRWKAGVPFPRNEQGHQRLPCMRQISLDFTVRTFSRNTSGFHESEMISLNEFLTISLNEFLTPSPHPRPPDQGAAYTSMYIIRKRCKDGAFELTTQEPLRATAHAGEL